FSARYLIHSEREAGAVRTVGRKCPLAAIVPAYTRGKNRPSRQCSWSNIGLLFNPISVGKLQQLEDYPRRRAPDIPFFIIEMINGIAPFRRKTARFGLEATLRYEGVQWNGKERRGLVWIQPEFVRIGQHADKRCNEIIRSCGHLVELAEHAHVAGREADLFVAFAQRRRFGAGVARLDFAAGEGNLASMGVERLRSLRQNEIGTVDSLLNRHENRRLFESRRFEHLRRARRQRRGDPVDNRSAHDGRSVFDRQTKIHSSVTRSDKTSR